jgi:ribose 1,5-bisphosphokinase PhnN
LHGPSKTAGRDLPVDKLFVKTAKAEIAKSARRIIALAEPGQTIHQPFAEAAFKKAMEQGTIGWVGFHHASLLGKFDGFEMSP